MSGSATRQIVVAGAGIAGLTAALAFASRGCFVRVFERAEIVEEAGAGLQLSPNATRLLTRLGVMGLLKPVAVRPDDVILRDGVSLSELARVPLGGSAETRWGAPYLAVHRADLHSSLLARVAQEPDIRVETAAPLRDLALYPAGFTASVDLRGRPMEAAGDLLIGADGVHSVVRSSADLGPPSRFGGELAWRVTVATGSDLGQELARTFGTRHVTALLRPGFHLVLYPVRAENAFNLVAFTKASPDDWRSDRAKTEQISRRVFQNELARCAAPLDSLVGDDLNWTCWPIHIVENTRWADPRGVALIGDAAHAMTPYAAQGAAMAIEDAVTLADAVTKGGALASTLAGWESARRARIEKVVGRAAFNRFVWHAAGPVAIARNVVLRLTPPTRLASDLDWLYGWTPSVVD